MGKESPMYLDPQMSMRTNLLAANSWNDVVAYFVKAMGHYSDKEILAISTKYDQVWYYDSIRLTDSITGERLTHDWTDIVAVLDE
jgi:hypothetical protein